MAYMTTKMFDLKNCSFLDTKHLVPYADLFNHSMYNPNCTWEYNQISGGFEIHASKDIEKGDKLYFCFGKQPNFKWLMNWGCMVPKNTPFNLAPVTIGLDPNDPELEMKKGILTCEKYQK